MDGGRDRGRGRGRRQEQGHRGTRPDTGYHHRRPHHQPYQHRQPSQEHRPRRLSSQEHRPRPQPSQPRPQSSQPPPQPQPPQPQPRPAAAVAGPSGGAEPSHIAQRAQRDANEPGRYEKLSVVTRPETAASKKGKSGDCINLKSNHFKLLTTTDWSLVQHRVDMIPEVETTRVKRQLMREHKKALGGYLFDGTVLYTTKNCGGKEFHSKHPTSEETIKIVVKPGTNLSPGDFHYLQIFNLLMKRCFEYLKLKLIGRDYFDSNAVVHIEQFGLELWPGYRTTISQYEDSILMIGDIIHKVVRKETAHDILRKVRNSPYYLESFRAEIVGKVVLTSYNNKTYLIDDIDTKVTPRSTFPYRDGQISYIEYYKSKYGINIRDLDQPLLISRAKARDIRAGMSEIIYLIPETCLLTGFSDAMRQDTRLLRDITGRMNVSPMDRVQKLNLFNRRLQNTPECIQDLREWNMKLDNSLVNIPARQLVAENIRSGNQQYSSRDDNYYWNKQLRSSELYATPNFGHWAVVIPERIGAQADKFVGMIMTAARGMKIQMGQPHVSRIYNDNIQTYIPELERVIANTAPRFIVCCVSNNNPARYSAIKKKCYVDRAVPTQVITSRSLNSRVAMSIATNIMIQIACKIGGTPWSVNIPMDSAMIVGYDVCHDTQDRSKSYGAMVATLDKGMTQYYSAVTAHKNGEELSNEFAINILHAATRFRELNGILPSTIFIYRDGVGEGQVHFVFEHEVNIIRQTLKSLYPNGDYKMAFVIVTKKINTRFFLANSSHVDNPKPGTVVDDVVTSPHRYDFFLVSQAVRHGTVSPTSYNIIFDNTGLSPDHFHQLSYKLCHLYFNYTGPIRVPAHCHNAHKLAFLAGQFLHCNPNEALKNTLYYL